MYASEGVEHVQTLVNGHGHRRDMDDRGVAASCVRGKAGMVGWVMEEKSDGIERQISSLRSAVQYLGVGMLMSIVGVVLHQAWFH